MKGFLPKLAGLLAFFVCCAFLLPRADPATLSVFVSTSVQEVFIDHLGEIDQCSMSQTLDGPSLSPSVACSSFLHTAVSSGAGFVGELTDVDGHAEYWVTALGSDPGCCGDPFPFEDPEAELQFSFTAGGFLYIAAPAPAVDITFTDLDGFNALMYGLTVNGIASDSYTFEGIPIHTPIPYLLEAGDFLFNFYAPDSIFSDHEISYDLRSVTIRDHASGEILPGAEITFSAVPVPEPGAAVLCGIGIAMIAASKRVGRKR